MYVTQAIWVLAVGPLCFLLVLLRIVASAQGQVVLSAPVGRKLPREIVLGRPYECLTCYLPARRYRFSLAVSSKIE